MFVIGVSADGLEWNWGEWNHGLCNIVQANVVMKFRTNAGITGRFLVVINSFLNLCMVLCIWP